MSRRSPRFLRQAVLLLAVFALSLGTVRTASAQAFTVSDPTGLNFFTYTWTPLTTTGGGYLLDPPLDQQTGQKADDFVSGASTPGFFMRYGTIGGVESVAFRLVENALYTDNRGLPAFAGQASIGMDTNNDGAIDIVFTVIGKNQNNGISYQAPGTGANVSPNTTSLGTPVLISAFTATNFDYRAADNTIYPGWTQSGPEVDAVLTFALSFQQINNALTALGKATVTSSTLLRFIAFTSTQTNAINQDVYGSNGISGAVRFDAPGGGFTEYTDLTGRPIPEPSTWVGLGALLATGLIVHRVRRRARALVPAVAPVS